MDYETLTPPSSRKTGDIASAIFHIIGASLSVAALCVLVIRAAVEGTASTIVGFSLYGASMLYYFVISAITHFLTAPKARQVFNELDEAGAYFFIAGSWTPLCLGPLGGMLGWVLGGLIWGTGIFFFVASISLIGQVRERLLDWYYTAITLVLPLLNPVRSRLPEATFAWVLLAGVLVVLGLLFRRKGAIPYSHSIWHASILTAAICQFFGLLSLGQA